MISLNSMSKSHAYNEQERLAKGSRNRGYNIATWFALSVLTFDDDTSIDVKLSRGAE